MQLSARELCSRTLSPFLNAAPISIPTRRIRSRLSLLSLSRSEVNIDLSSTRRGRYLQREVFRITGLRANMDPGLGRRIGGENSPSRSVSPFPFSFFFPVSCFLFFPLRRFSPKEKRALVGSSRLLFLPSSAARRDSFLHAHKASTM